MIEFYTGIMGSGKTNRSVQYLYDIFLDSKSKDFGKFKKFYTNINEFNFSAFPDGVGFPLDFDNLLESLTILHNAYKNKDNDTQLNILAESLGLKDAFFVFDECQDYFGGKNTVLLWWLTYHRHFFQNIILITPDLTLIESKYKRLAEFYYLAVPSALRVFLKSFTYIQFTGSRMTKAQKSAKISIKYNEEVFKLYKSGGNTQSPRVIYKYLAIAVGALALSALIIGLIVHFMFGGHDKKDVKTDKNVSLSAGLHVNKKTSEVDLKKNDSLPTSVTFICSSNGCEYNTDFYTLAFMKFYIKKYKLTVINVAHVSESVYIYKYNVPDDRFFKVLSYE